MGVKNKFSSFRKKYLSMSNWMDVDSFTGNARKVGGLFKELRDLSTKKDFDKSLTFDAWCAQNDIQEKDLAAYRRKIVKYLVGYIILTVLLFAYFIYFISEGRYMVSLYMAILTLSALLYTFKQYMVWALLKMRKMNCSFKALMSWTFSKK